MRITVTQEQTAPNPAAPVFLVIMVAAASYSYYAYPHPLFGLGIVACLVALAGYLHSSWKQEILLQIDEAGIFDRRLGMGKILWEDVEEVHLQVTEANRFLCLRVSDPEPYFARLQGAQREKMNFHRKLGFQGINIDIWPLDVNLLELKRQIDSCIRSKRSS